MKHKVIPLKGQSFGCLRSQIRRKQPVLVISSSNPYCSDRENEQNAKDLTSFIELTGFEYFRVDGTFTDSNGKTIKDQSIVAYCNSIDEFALLNFGLMFGKKFNQTNILFCGSVNRLALISPKDETKQLLSDFKSKSIDEVLSTIKCGSYHVIRELPRHLIECNTLNEESYRKEFRVYLATHNNLDEWLAN